MGVSDADVADMGVRASPQSQRPRERVLSLDAAMLTDAELIAIVLRTGRPGEDAVSLARRLLTAFGGVRGLLDARPDALAATVGLGPAKTASLKATRALLERYDAESIRARDDLSSSDAVHRYLRVSVGHEEREVFGALFLDARFGLIAIERLFLGSVDRAAVYPREVVKACLRHNAGAVILFHNHPSGIAEPSASDIQLTERLRTILAEVDVRLVDHVVVGRGRQVSMAERGLI